MKFAALLGAIAVIPIAAVAGYFAHQDPGLPGFGQYAAQELGVKHVPGQDSDDWLAVAVSGPNKGGEVDAYTAFQMFPTQKALEKIAQGKVKFYEVICLNYSTGGDKSLMFIARTAIRKCSAHEKTRKQVGAYVKSQISG